MSDNFIPDHEFIADPLVQPETPVATEQSDFATQMGQDATNANKSYPNSDQYSPNEVQPGQIAPPTIGHQHVIVPTWALTNRAMADQLVGDPKPEVNDDSIQDTISPIDFIPYEVPASAVADAIVTGVKSDAFREGLIAAKRIVGNEIGTLGQPLTKYPPLAPTAAKSTKEILKTTATGDMLKDIGGDKKASKEVLNYWAKVLNAKKILNTEGLSQKETAKAVQDYGRELAKTQYTMLGKRPRRMFEGGEVKMADGGEATNGFIPDDQFIPDTHAAPEGGDFIADSDFKSDDDIRGEKYGSTGQQVLTGLEGAAKGILGPIATGIEVGSGLTTGDDIRGREEENPITHGVAEAGGFMGSLASGAGLGAGVAKLGMKATEIAGLAGRTLSTAENIASHVVQSAVEIAALQTSDEASKLIASDPNASLQTAIPNIGLAALLGAGGGAALGGVSALWKATAGEKVGQLIADFRGRTNQLIANPEPREAIQHELETHYSAIRDMADEVYGVKGLKAQDIEAAMPEMSPKITQQAHEVADSVGKTIDKMVKNQNSYPPRLTVKLQGDLEQFMARIQDGESSASEIFNATQDLKQSLQGYAKYEKFVKPVDEAYDFVRDSKSLAASLRESLEDGKIWGKAADRQKAINKGFSDFLPSLKDFEKKFTTEIAGDRSIDPGKLNTYLNQVGKASGETKQKMLGNFLDASEKYRQVIADTHSNLGIDSGLPPTSLVQTRETLKELSNGAKLADMIFKEAPGDILGATVGESIGHGIGHAGIGAFLGAHTLGPYFNKALGAIIKPLLMAEIKSPALKSVLEYTKAIVKGETLMNKATNSIFGGGEVLPASAYPTKETREKLQKSLDEIRIKPEKLMEVGSNVAHYMPDHSAAAAMTATTVVQYLQSINPHKDKVLPLDRVHQPSKDQLSTYNRTLDIAQQPLLVIDKIKQGTITPKDIMALRTMYPALYTRLTQKLTNDMFDHVAKGEQVPYKTRIGLSLFIGQPLDSSMTPAAIISSQPKPLGQQDQDASGSSQQGSPKPKSNALNKFSSQYQTPSQTSAKHRQRD